MAMTITEAMRALVAELEEGEVVAPLAQRFTLANVWADLARIAGEAVPAEAAAIVGDAMQTLCEPIPVPARGSYRDHARQFGPDAYLPAD